MSIQIPVRLGPAELALIEQLQAIGATVDAERLATVGLPTRKVEAYHYTDLKQLWRSVPPAASGADGSGVPPLALAGAFLVSLVNGAVRTPESAPDGIFVHETDGSPLTQRDDIVVRLNLALVEDSLALEISGEGEHLVHIDRRTEGEAGHSASAARIFVADGASATIVETYATSEAAHAANHATHMHIGRGAKLTHVTLDLSSAEATQFATHEYHLGPDAQVLSLAVHAGSALARTNIYCRMEGEGANGRFTGLNLVNEGQHSDMTLEVTHSVPRTGAKPLFKQIARGRSRAVFQGRIVVEKGAQKTDAKMSMQGLMLSDGAEILSKPELEIYADDVVCGHGSTCGRLDEGALFYLMSRGIARPEAETMLVRAFLAELVDPIEAEGVRDVLTGVIERWLGGAGDVA